MRVVLADYGAGNLRSVCSALARAGAEPVVSDDDWRDALRRLIADAALRARMGRAGRVYAEQHYSIDAHADVLAALFRRVA